VSSQVNSKGHTKLRLNAYYKRGSKGEFKHASKQGCRFHTAVIGNHASTHITNSTYTTNLDMYDMQTGERNYGEGRGMEGVPPEKALQERKAKGESPDPPEREASLLQCPI
jgi:hypothetical protein